MTTTAAPARISRSELERRWTEVRAAMTAAGIDVLITQADAGPYMGYVRYLADLVPPDSSGLTLVFPLEGGMTLIRQGQGAEQDLASDPSEDGELRGVSRVLTTGYYPSLSYTADAEGARIVEALRPWSQGTIGMLGAQRISMAAADSIRTALPAATLVDATDAVDAVMARKSEEEKTFIRAVAAIQDAVTEQVFNEIEPGVSQRTVAKIARRYAYELGATHGFALTASAPLGTPAIPRPMADDRAVEKGDLLQLLMETDGPGGYYVHMTRGLVFGEVPASLTDEVQVALGAQRFLADLAGQEISGADLDRRHIAYMKEIGRPYTGGSYLHGHGHDVMQRPVARPEERLRFGPDMNVGIHPTYVWKNAFIWVCSNFLTTADGAEPLHHYPAEIVSK